MLNLVKKTMYVVVRWNSLFDFPYINKLKNKIYELMFDAKNIRVLRNVLICAPHPNEKSQIKIGRNFEAGSFVHVDYSGGLVIGDDVTISENSKIYTHSHTVENANIHWRKQKTTFSQLSIGSGAWIASNCVVLASCTQIGSGAVIGAGSLVTTNIPDNAIAVGSPAKVIRYRSPSD